VSRPDRSRELVALATEHHALALAALAADRTKKIERRHRGLAVASYGSPYHATPTVRRGDQKTSAQCALPQWSTTAETRALGVGIGVMRATSSGELSSKGN